MSRPVLVPEDRSALAVSEAAVTSLHRAMAGLVLGRIHSVPPEHIVRRAWPDDPRAGWLTRGPSSPDSMTGSAAALAPVRVNPLLLVAPGSAAAQLFAFSMKLNFEGVYQHVVPHVITYPVPLFAGEGAPIAVVQGATAKAAVGPVKKLICAAALTRELNESTPEDASTILGRMLGESTAPSLDAVVFDAQPADNVRPAGLLYGVTPLTPATATGPSVDVIGTDIAAFAAAFSAARIRTANMTIIAASDQYWKVKMTRGFETLPFKLIETLGLEPGTVVAAIPEALASGYQGEPELELAKHTTLHFEDSNPQQLGEPGSPNIVAAPTFSTFQTDSLAVKCRVRCAWASCQPGSVQVMSVNW